MLQLRREIKHISKNLYIDFIRSSELSIQSDLNKFSSFVNRKCKTTDIPGITRFDNSYLTFSQDTVDSFAQHFASVF